MQVEVLFYPARKFPKAWEVAELSDLEVCPRFGSHERHPLGPSAEFFEKLNHICYMWMPRSNGLYNPLDSPEPSLSDLFGSSTTLDGSSIASVVDCVARARTDDDSVESDIAPTHVDSDGTVTSVHLGPDGTINSISQFFSSYTDCQPVLPENPFCLSTGEDSAECAMASRANGLRFSPACTEQPVPHVTAPCEEYGDDMPVRRYIALPPVAWAYYAKGVSTRLVKQAKGLDPLYEFIGVGSDLRNWMPDTGASSHFYTMFIGLAGSGRGFRFRGRSS